jgi:hypothetical protein
MSNKLIEALDRIVFGILLLVLVGYAVLIFVTRGG